ncbi:MAG TPA: hypothetical protein DDZ51_00440 [Planctomycetaceae bacterium]|nr:hypothetical protein [Planctomycetaceae bacterium]
MELVWLASNDTMNRLCELLPEWLEAKLQVRVVAAKEEDNRIASRRLKVQARQLVEGDFFQLDADLLLARPLRFSDFENVASVAAALNRETLGDFKEDFENKWSQQLFRQAGWKWPENYFNTGFLFWKDNERTHGFCKGWQEARDEFTARVGKVIDQPAFNRVACEHEHVTVVDSCYNSPVSTLPQLSRKARCYHYYADQDGHDGFRGTALGYLAEKLSNKDNDARAAIEQFARSPRPFVGWGANSTQYRMAGQWANYFERKLRVSLNHLKRKFAGAPHRN